jgi:hypothetical protein
MAARNPETRTLILAESVRIDLTLDPEVPVHDVVIRIGIQDRRLGDCAARGRGSRRMTSLCYQGQHRAAEDECQGDSPVPAQSMISWKEVLASGTPWALLQVRVTW